MENILPFLPQVNAMFIFSSRRFVEWLPQGDGEKIHIIELSPLSDQSIKAMVCNMLECENLDQELYDVILRFTNGNPLYIEEFISHIKRNGKYKVEGGRASIAVDAARELPNSIHGLILSEMSELDETTRTVLQTASVIGKDFNLSLLNSILDQPVDEMNALKIPIQMNIISLKTVYTSGSSMEKVFTFNHDLAREVIYDSILNKNKRELHQRIGEYIEEKKQKEIENYYETLYLHFSKAGNNRKAWDYCFKTAMKHKSDYNFHDSLNYYGIFTQALESKGIKDDRIMQAYRDMGYIHSVMAQYDQALEYLNKALGMAFLSDDKYIIQIMIAEVYKDQGLFRNALEILDEVEPAIKQEHPIYGKILQMRCGIYFAMGKAEALFYAEKARNILLKVQDFRNLSETNKQMGILYFSRGNADSALRYLNESYTYAEKANDLEMMAKVSGNLGIVYHAMGMVSKALEFLERSMELSKRISYLRGYVAVCINLGILYMDKGYFEKSLGLFHESLQKAKEIDNRLHECISLINLGDVSYELGLFEQARNYFLQSLEVARQIHVQVEEGVNYIGLAKVYLKTEAYDKVPKMLDTAYEIFKEADDATYFSDYYFYKGLYELQQGRNSKALEYCEKAIAAARGCKNDSKQLKALRLKGNIHLKKKDYKNALLMFEKAITLARQIESDYELAKGYYGSYQVLSKLGRTEEALERLEKAKGAIVKVDRCRWTDIILCEEVLKPADNK